MTVRSALAPRHALALGLGLGLGLSLGAVGCTTSSEAPTAPTVGGKPAVISVKLALNWLPEPEFGGFYEGVLGGHYAAAGFDVEVVPGGPGAPTLELLGTGRVQAAITDAADLLVKRDRGLDVVGAWPAFQLNPQGLMVHTASGITAIADVPAGATIAIEQGAPFQRFLWARHDWDDKVRPVPYSGGVAPFLADPTLIQQAFITAEPCAARAKGADVTFLKASDVGWNPYGTLVAFTDPPPPWADRFIAATQVAWQAYRAAPDRANAELARLNDQLDPSQLDCITTAQDPFLTGTDGLGVSTPARWDAVARDLVEIGMLPANSTANGAWIQRAAPATQAD